MKPINSKLIHWKVHNLSRVNVLISEFHHDFERNIKFCSDRLNLCQTNYSKSVVTVDFLDEDDDYDMGWDDIGKFLIRPTKFDYNLL